MADDAIVREEVWFDSSDGSSRVHGYVWWPEGSAPGIADTARDEDVDPEEPGRTGEEDGSSPSSVGAPPSAADEAHAARTPRHAALTGNDHGDMTTPDEHEDETDQADADAEVPASSAPEISHALERVARLVAINPVPDAPSEDSMGAAREEMPDDVAGQRGEDGPAAVAPHAREVTGGDVPHDLAGGASLDDGTVPVGEGDPQDDASADVKGIVQLVHGMAEHIGRYDEFARFLAAHGYVVCGHDHIGHGKSAEREQLGCLPARRGRDILVEDVGRLHSIMQERLGDDLPYFLFGHSLGSFVVRAYVAQDGTGLAGAIICGTGHVSPSKSSMGHAAARLLGVFHGQYGKSRLLHSMGVGAYVKAVRQRGSENDWLSYNEANVAAYDADELCGFPFSAGGYATVTALTKEVCTPAWASRVPRLLPLLFIGGNADPVGDNGEGVRLSAQLVRDAGCADVTCMIYKHMRHEILNEDDRRMVFDDVLFWLEVRS